MEYNAYEIKCCFGTSKDEFKTRYNNHKSSFVNII